MTEFITITLDDSEAQEAFQRLIDRLADPTSLHRKAAGHLKDVAEESFETQTSPDGLPWAKLAPSTIISRTRRGHWPGSILQLTGLLANSIRVEHGRDYAQIGSNMPYARLQHKGGKTGRGHRTEVPARPFLGLSQEARENIQRDMLEWIDLNS